MRKYILGSITVLIVCLLGYSLYHIQQSPEDRRLNAVEVHIQTPEQTPIFMDSDDVLREMAQLGLNYKGVPIDSIDVGMVERKLKQNPLFKDIEVYITAYSNKMIVDITQQEALFSVQTPQKSFYVTAERGIIPINPRYSIYLPIVSGEVSEEFACTKLYDLMAEIAKDSYFRNYFGQVYVDSKEGVILCPRIGKTYVILGHSTAWAEMLHKYKVFDQSVLSRMGSSAYEYVKLSYKNQVVARPRYNLSKQDSLTL